MFKGKLAKTLALGVCLTLASAGAVFATEEGKVDTGRDNPLAVESIQLGPDTPVSSVSNSAPQVSEEITNLQIEIDRYLFNQHSEDISKRGFKVTHTVPTEEYVEIGIEPYSEENAEYLYSLFGKDKIKVVAGEQVILYDLAVSSGGGVSPGYNPDAPDAPAGEFLEMTTTNAEIDPAAQDGDIAVDADLVSAQDDAPESATAESSSNNVLYYALGGAVALGAGAFGARKLLSQKK